MEIKSKHDYESALLWLEKWGKKQYAKKFAIHHKDKEILIKLICYFLKDEPVSDLG